MKRKIIEIDAAKCNGCGDCVSACAEGAIQMVDGKAKLITDSYCDGLGACIGDCPQGAITIIERDADEFDEEAVKKHMEAMKTPSVQNARQPAGSCPGLAAFTIENRDGESNKKSISTARAELTQWPVQLHLVPVNAPYWEGADMLIAADCVPFAYADFHSELLKGKKLIIACPKLDDVSTYTDKLTAIFAENNITSITVAHMEVPCCNGIISIAKKAWALSGKEIAFNTIKISTDGKVLDRTES